MTEFYIIRHGESESNKKHEFTGQLDYPLTELGVRQAETLKIYFKSIKPDLIYSSDLSRAIDTARAVAKMYSLSVITDSALREVMAGEWQGKKFDDIESEFPEEYRVWRNDIGHCRPAGGESIEELGARVYGAISRIATENDGKVVVIATHATPIRALETLSRYGDISRMCDVPWVKNASVSKFVFDTGRLDLIFSSDISHLGGMVTSLPENC